MEGVYIIRRLKKGANKWRIYRFAYLEKDRAVRQMRLLRYGCNLEERWEVKAVSLKAGGRIEVLPPRRAEIPKDRDKNLLSVPIPRVGYLYRLGLYTLAEAASCTSKFLRRAKQVGPDTVKKLDDFLYDEYGIHLPE